MKHTRLSAALTRNRFVASCVIGALVLLGSTFAVATPAGAAPEGADVIVKTVTFNPGVQKNYTVPEDALGVVVTVAGAQGGSRTTADFSGGAGGMVTVDLGTKYNGDALQLLVGGTNRNTAGTNASYLATTTELLAIAGAGGSNGFYTAGSVTTILDGGAGGFSTASANGGDGRQYLSTHFSGLGARGAVAGAAGYGPGGAAPALASAPAAVVNGQIKTSTTTRFLGEEGNGYASGGSARGDAVVSGVVVRGASGGGSGYLAPGLTAVSTGSNGATGTAAPFNGFITLKVTVPAHPSIIAEGGVTSGSVTKAGDPVTYSYTVTNNGDIDLTDVDLQIGGLTGDPATVVCEADSLAVGASTTCVATYTATQADIDAGQIPSTVTPVGTDTNGFPAVVKTTPAPVTVAPVRSLGIVAQPIETAATKAGEKITFEYLVTNTGSATSTQLALNPGAFTGSGDAPVLECPSGSVAPGASVTCTASYTVTQQDIDAGVAITNTVTAGATQAGSAATSGPATASLAVTRSPSLTTAVTQSVSTPAVGEKISYSFVVTNSGNSTLIDPAVGDIRFSGAGELGEVTCPTTESLAPGATLTCTASYTVTQKDLDAGEPITISVAGSATQAGSPVTSSAATASLGVTQSPALSVVVTPDVSTVVVGQKVGYSFVVTNTGNVTITDPGVGDVEFSAKGKLGDVVCPATEALAPGESITCTASYTVTEADLAGGPLTISAVGTGTAPQGASVVSQPSAAASIAVTAAPVNPSETTPIAAPNDVRDQRLAATGAETTTPIGAIALLLLAVGGSVLALHRGRVRQARRS
jgi:hypothetical protein